MADFEVERQEDRDPPWQKKKILNCRLDQILILILCFLINVQAASSVSTIGIFLVEFMEYYQAAKTSVTWIAGTNLGVSVIVGPLLGLLLKKFGSRVVGVMAALLTASGLVLAAFINNLTSLYFTFGLMAGVGPCAYYAIANCTVQRYFSKRRSVASAFVLTAFSVGGFLWPPIGRWLIDNLCWQGTMLVLAALHIQMIVVFVCVGLINRERQWMLERANNAVREDRSERFSDMSASQPSGIVKEARKKSKCKRIKPWLLLSCMYSTGVAFGMILHMSILVYTPTRCKELGIGKTRAAFLISIVNFAGGFCRIPAGLIGDLKYVNRGFLVATAIAIGGTLSLLSRFLTSFVLLAIFSAIYGCFIAIYLGLQTVVLSDISGMEHLQVAMGVLLAGHGASNLLLHPTAGALLDATGTADTVFTVTGFVGILGSALVVLASIITIRRKRLKKMKYKTNPSTVEEICLKDG